MGVLDKIKNAFFEVEYVEVEEKPKKPKKSKNHEHRPIAKKVVLPGKKDQKIEELEEEELKDEDFEIRPMTDTTKEKKEEFKFMDDHDFEMDEDIPVEPEMTPIYPTDEKANPFYKDPYPFVEEEEEYRPKEEYPKREEYPISQPYNRESSTTREYAPYEKKEEKTYFKPSPIISPIYGILDKNYRKEDVKEKKDIRITSSYTRGVSLDEVRKKAYGTQEETPKTESKFEVEEAEDNVLVDLTKKEKPQVKELTVGDAEEYFEDLGLEYNVDYVDVSTDKSAIAKKEMEEVLEETTEEPPVVEENTLEEEAVEEMEEVVEQPLEEVQEEEPEVEEENDNLFDLIDSMYQENE